jgi:hypothetical protein
MARSGTAPPRRAAARLISERIEVNGRRSRGIVLPALPRAVASVPLVPSLQTASVLRKSVTTISKTA